jgi:hypothetical protein
MAKSSFLAGVCLPDALAGCLRRALDVPLTGGNSTVTRGLTRLCAPRSIMRSATVDRPYPIGSQADSAGSIPVTRSTREKRCHGLGFEDCRPLRAVDLRP